MVGLQTMVGRIIIYFVNYVTLIMLCFRVLRLLVGRHKMPVCKNITPAIFKGFPGTSI